MAVHAQAGAHGHDLTGDGLYLVGRDLQPGTYQSAGAADSDCYFSRLLSGPSTSDDIIDNGKFTGPITVPVAASDYELEVRGCQPFHKIA